MTSTLKVKEDRSASPYPAPGRRFGYLVGAIVNGAFLWVAHQLLDWEWPRFLTSEFEELLPLITVSFVASIVVNLLWFVADPRWLKALGNMVTAGIGFFVALRTYQVFPFDFSTYAVDWTGLTRFVLLVAMAGTVIGFVVESVKLLAAPFRSS